MSTLVGTWTESFPDLGNMFSNLQMNARLSNLTFSKILLALFTLYTTSRILAFFRNLKVKNKVQYLPQIRWQETNSLLNQIVSHLPGHRPLFHPLWPPGVFIPMTWWNPGLKHNWKLRESRMWLHFIFYLRSSKIWPWIHFKFTSNSKAKSSRLYPFFPAIHVYILIILTSQDKWSAEEQGRAFTNLRLSVRP